MKEIFFFGLRLGLLGFGGPLSVLAMLEEECVKKRGWVSQAEFSQELSLAKIFPGPLATIMVIRLASLRSGKIAGILAGVMFILPSFFLVLVLGQALSLIKAGSPWEKFEVGLEASSLAAIFAGVVRIGRGYVSTRNSVFVLVSSFAFILFFPRLEPLAILFFMLLGVWTKRSLMEGASLLLLIVICLKAAIFCFGTGLAIVPLLQSEIVDHWKLVTLKDFLRALALGQMTPGPVLITVSWVGYKVAGFLGAVVATIAIFLPGFFLALAVAPRLMHRLRENQMGEAIFSWAVPAVVGAVGAGAVKLLYLSSMGPKSWAIFVSSAILLFWKSYPLWFIIPLGGLISICI